jgi:tetratricopeptide (TPR) repeat protein
MAIAHQHLTGLSEADRLKLEHLLATFDTYWEDNKLEQTVRQLPPPGPLRQAALIELVKIDLERQWQRGRRAQVEGYVKAFPELGPAEAVPADLLLAEYQVRAEFGAPADLAAFARRFPRQAEVLRRLLGEEHTSHAHAARGHGTPASQESKVSQQTTITEAQPPALPLPEQFGRYRLLRKLGQGGMGTVYLAHDSKLDRRVALKIPRFTAEDGPEGLERFHREARAAATIDHPNICPVHDVDAIGGIHYLAMAYIEGKSLAELVRGGQPLPHRQAAKLVHRLALALQEAHSRHVIHRDLKPSNIMINARGEPVVMDFGLARRVLPGDIRLTQSGSVLGTAAYMSPEQARGDVKGIGPGCDIYSLGVVLYELLTGRLPFQGPMVAVLAQILTEPPEPPSKIRPDLDPVLEAICLKAMAKKVEDRYPSMQALATALAEYLSRSTSPQAAIVPNPFIFPDQPTASPVRAATDRERGGRKKWALLASAAGSLGVLAVAALVLFWQTPHGTVRIESDDPAVEIVFDKTGPTVKGADKEVITLRPGEHGILIKRGDFVFEADKFVLRKGETIVLKLELLEGKLQLVQDGKVIATRDVPLPKQYGSVNKSKPDYPKVIQEKAPTADPTKPVDPLATADLEGRVQSLVNLLVNGDYRAARQQFDDNLKKAVPIERLKQLWAALTAHAGAFLRTTPHRRYKADRGEVVVAVTCVFANTRFVVEVGFYNDQAISTVWFRDSPYYLARALEFHGKKQYRDAITACEEALRLDPEYVEAFRVRAWAHWAAGMPEDAIKDSSEVLKRNPRDTGALVDRSYDYLNTGAFAKAVDDASAALEIDPKLPAAFANRGTALADLGSHESGLADLDEAVRLDPNNAIVIFFRGLVHEKLGHRDLANADWDRAYKLDGSLRGRDLRLSNPPPAPRETVGQVRLFQGSRQINSVALFANDRLALSGDNEYKVRIWDIATGKQLFLLPGHEEHVWAVAVSPDGGLAASSGGGRIENNNWTRGADFDIRLWDIASRKELRRLRGHGNQVQTLVFSPDSKKLLSASLDGTLRLWDVGTGDVLVRLAGNAEGLGGAAFSPDGSKVLIAGGHDKTMHLWDLSTHNKERTFPGHKGLVRCVAVSPDGKLALSGSYDKTVCLWDVASGEKRHTFTGPRTIVNCVAFSGDGRWALAGGGAEGGGGDYGIYLWDIKTGQLVDQLKGHTLDVLSLALARDGRHLLSSSSDGTLRWWRLPDSHK